MEVSLGQSSINGPFLSISHSYVNSLESSLLSSGGYTTKNWSSFEGLTMAIQRGHWCCSLELGIPPFQRNPNENGTRMILKFRISNIMVNHSWSKFRILIYVPRIRWNCEITSNLSPADSHILSTLFNYSWPWQCRWRPHQRNQVPPPKNARRSLRVGDNWEASAEGTLKILKYPTAVAETIEIWSFLQ